MLHTKALIEKKNISEQTGIIDAVVGSTSVVDRMDDIIDQAGWLLKDFKTNPVILWGHNQAEEKPPIGKALKVWIENKGKKNAKLMFKIQFDLQDSFAAEIFRKIKDGFLNAVSVGFLPEEWEELDPDDWFGGLKYTKQQLLELSVVPVPANPQALLGLRSFSEKDKRFTPKKEEVLFPQTSKKDLAKMLNKDLSDEKPDKPTTPEGDKPTTTPDNAGDKPEGDKEGEKQTDPEGDKKPDKSTESKTPEESKKTGILENIKKFKETMDSLDKAGRVLSSENEEKVRHAIELLGDVLNQLDKQDPTENPQEPSLEDKKDPVEADIGKGTIPYKDLETLPESENWDGPGEIAKAEVEDLKLMCTWFDTEKAEDKGSYKLAHHKAEGHKAVWRGVAASMATLLGAKGGLDIPEEDKKGVYNHLVKHYKEFTKEAPDFALVENQILGILEEELQALVLDREDKHVVRVVKKALTKGKREQALMIKALTLLNLALSQVNLKKGEVNKK